VLGSLALTRGDAAQDRVMLVVSVKRRLEHHQQRQEQAAVIAGQAALRGTSVSVKTCPVAAAIIESSTCSQRDTSSSRQQVPQVAPTDSLFDAGEWCGAPQCQQCQQQQGSLASAGFPSAHSCSPGSHPAQLCNSLFTHAAWWGPF